MIKRFYRVNDKLFRGGAPDISDVFKLKQKFNVNRIVSLDKESGEHINRACKLLNIDHIIIPIDASSRSSILQLLKFNIVNLLTENEPVFVHCLHGKDRTGLAVAIFRCKNPSDSWSCDKALKEAKSFGFGTGIDDKVLKLYEKIISKSCSNNYKTDLNDINMPLVGLTNNPTGLKGNFSIK